MFFDKIIYISQTGQAFNESNPDFRVNEVEINPAPATFIIWGPIYVWQVLFLAYGISTIFR